MNDDNSSSNGKNEIDIVYNCCLSNILNTCSLDFNPSRYVLFMPDNDVVASSLEFITWPNSCLPIIDLTDDMTEYLRRLNVISHNHQVAIPILERDLILNRIYQQVDVENVNLKICPLHRYTFGVGWRVHNRCHHTDHDMSFQQFSSIKKRKKTPRIEPRIAPLHLVEKIVGFPYGGKICDKHRKELYQEETVTIHHMNVNYKDDDMDTSTVIKTETTVQSFITPNKATHHQAQRILMALEQSPIKSHSKKRLLKQKPGATRRLVAKLRKAVAATVTTIATSLAPEDADLLITVSIPSKDSNNNFEIIFQLAELDAAVTSRTRSTQDAADENFLTYLVEMYKAYEEKGFPYNEKIRLLALIHDDWNLTYEDIMSRFGCTQYAIKTARSLKSASSTPLHIEHKPYV